MPGAGEMLRARSCRRCESDRLEDPSRTGGSAPSSHTFLDSMSVVSLKRSARMSPSSRKVTRSSRCSICGAVERTQSTRSSNRKKRRQARENLAPDAASTRSSRMPTAWQVLFDTSKLDKGQIVLIDGGSGGVGSMAVQLAKWKGDTFSRPRRRRIKSFSKSSAPTSLRHHRLSQPEIRRDREERRRRSRHDRWRPPRHARGRRWRKAESSSRSSAERGASQDLDVRGADILVHLSSDELSQIAKLIDDGAIHPVVTQVLPLSAAAKAHQTARPGTHAEK